LVLTLPLILPLILSFELGTKDFIFPVAAYHTAQAVKAVKGALRRRLRRFTLDWFYRLCFPAVAMGDIFFRAAPPMSGRRGWVEVLILFFSLF